MSKKERCSSCRPDELSGLFAELACTSSVLANLILQRYPTYRHAKQQPAHPFWREDCELMHRDVLQELDAKNHQAEQMLVA